MNLISYIHFLGSIFTLLYPFIIPKNKYDYLYIYYIILLNLSWMIFNGECFISLIFKKIKNKKYEIGSNINADDIKNITGSKFYNIYIRLCLLLNSLSFIYVIYRNDYPKYLYMFLLFSITYGFFYLNFENQNILLKYKIFKIFKYIFIFISIIFIILFSNYLYKNKKY
jgi:hypothetical protein